MGPRHRMALAWMCARVGPGWCATIRAQDFDVQLTSPERELDVPAGTWILQVEVIGDHRSPATVDGEPEFVVEE